MKFMVKSALLVALLASTASVSAGYRGVIQVYIDDTYRYAMGNMVDARGSADGVQQVSCVLTSTGLGGCQAANTSGGYRSCYTTNPDLVNTIRSIGDDSHIYFQWNPDGSCNYIQIQNSSWMKSGAVSGY